KVNAANFWLLKGNYMLNIGNFNQAAEFANLTIELAEQESSSVTLVKGYYLAAEAYLRTGDLKLVENKLDEAAQLAEQINVKPEMANIYKLLGVHYIEGNQPQKAQFYYQKAREIYEEIGDSFGLSSVLTNLSIFGYRQQNYQLASSYLQDALQISKQTGDKAGRVRTLTNLSMVSSTFGYYQQAIEHASEALAISESIQSSLGIWYNLLHLLEANTYLGRKVQSETYRGRLMTVFDSLESSVAKIHTLADIGYFLEVENSLQLAYDYLISAYDLIENLDHSPEELEVRLNLAHVAHLNGDHRAARKWFEPVIEGLKNDEHQLGELTRPIYANWVIYVLGNKNNPELALNNLKIGYLEIQKQVSQVSDQKHIQKFISRIPTYQKIVQTYAQLFPNDFELASPIVQI
ncbi:MAG: tetratricopeptide repeat protein, partial [Chloroflexota bacterium]